jgi:hypothetical protein
MPLSALDLIAVQQTPCQAKPETTAVYAPADAGVIDGGRPKSASPS